MGRDHMWLMMHMCHPICCHGCSKGVESAGHELDTPTQTPKIGIRGLLRDDKRSCIMQKIIIVHAKKVQKPWQVHCEGFWCTQWCEVQYSFCSNTHPRVLVSTHPKRDFMHVFDCVALFHRAFFMIFDSIALGSKQELLCNNLSNAKKCFLPVRDSKKSVY